MRISEIVLDGAFEGLGKEADELGSLTSSKLSIPRSIDSKTVRFGRS